MAAVSSFLAVNRVHYGEQVRERKYLSRLMFQRQLSVSFFVFLSLFVSLAQAGSEEFFAGDTPRNIAHRGGVGLFPESTLVAYRGALDLGVPMLEGDLHMTSDGVIVVNHDATVTRTTDGRGMIVDMTLAEVKTLDAGYRFTPDRGESFPYRGQGVEIPTLAELFTEFPEVPFTLEIKQFNPKIEAEVVAVIEEFDMVDQVCVTSFIDGVNLRLRRLNPEICTGSGVLEMIAFALLPVEAMQAIGFPAKALQMPWQLEPILPMLIEKAHQMEIEVHVWTVNDTAVMERMLALGVDGIITDYPDRLQQLLE